MNPDDRDYGQENDIPQDNRDDDRYSKQNPSQNPENRNNRRRGGKIARGIGNKVKQSLRQNLDPRERIRQLKNPKEIIKRFQKDLLKNVAKEAAKKAALNPWTWIIMGAIALIIFLALIIAGADEELKDCGGGDGPQVSVGMTGPDKAKVGDKLEYKITVTGSTGSVTIKNPIPEGTRFESASNGGKNEQNVVTWELSEDGEVTLTLIATKDNANLVNIATIDSIGGGQAGVESSGGSGGGGGEIPEASGDDYERVQFRGATVNNRTKKMLEAAEKDFGEQFRITQGSYSTGVAASAGTHDGGGVVDISTGGMDKAKIDKAVTALRKKNFAAWYRTPAQGFTPHIHAVAIGDKELAAGAKQQVEDFKNGKNGLAGGGADDGPQVSADEGCEGEASGAVSEGYVAPSSNNCGGKYKNFDSPIGKNFGDPNCSFDKNKLGAMLKEKDPKNAEKWMNVTIPNESCFDTNAYVSSAEIGTPDAAGAWGMYQMGSSKPPGKAPPAPGKNGEFDRGDVNWELQTTNAVNYLKKINNNMGAYWQGSRKPPKKC